MIYRHSDANSPATKGLKPFIPGGLAAGGGPGCLRCCSGFKLCGPDGGICRKAFEADADDCATFSNALKADPSDGRPRGRLRDFASAADESTKRCDACVDSDGGS